MKNYLFFLAVIAGSSLHAEEAMDLPPEQPFGYSLLPIILVGLIFYFVLFRPEQKRRKELEKVRSALQVGDKVNVVGIIGTVAKIEPETIVVRMYDGSKLEFVKAAVSEVLSNGEPLESKDNVS